MFLRRLYSSIPQRAGVTADAAVTPKAASRGRTRPVRVKVAPRVKPVVPESSSVATASAAVPTHGRRLRRGLTRADTDRVSSEVARPLGFQPVTLYPFQAGLHISFTPGHMPLPVHVGTKGYLAPGSSEAARGALFERPTTPNPLEGVDLSGPSPLGEHLNLTKAFSHPALTHHLGASAPGTSLRALDVDADSRLQGLLEAAASANATAAEDAWETALDRLGVKAADAAISAAEQASINDAIAGVDGLIARLAATKVADEVVHLDSVRRKRKKKMNKHKFKKRRKATRAERRRLGK